MTLHVIYGPPAAGKTTHVNEHRQPGELVIDLDLIAVALGSADPHRHARHIQQVAGAARAIAIRKTLDLGLDAWVIDTWLRTRQLLEADATQYVLVDPGQLITLQRAERDGRPADSIAAIRRWYANPPQPPRTAPQAHTEPPAPLTGVVADWW